MWVFKGHGAGQERSAVLLRNLNFDDKYSIDSLCKGRHVDGAWGSHVRALVRL